MTTQLPPRTLGKAHYPRWSRLGVDHPAELPIMPLRIGHGGLAKHLYDSGA